MTFPDRDYEKAKMKHMEHKENGVERKEDCAMCDFYSDD